MLSRTALGNAGIGLDILDRVYDYIAQALTGQDRFCALREIVRAQSTLCAIVAEQTGGKTFLPSASWGLTVDDFDPFLHSFFMKPVNWPWNMRQLLPHVCK